MSKCFVVDLKESNAMIEIKCAMYFSCGCDKVGQGGLSAEFLDLSLTLCSWGCSAYSCMEWKKPKELSDGLPFGSREDRQ